MWNLIPSLDVVVQGVSVAFTCPSFRTHCEVLVGWVMCIGRRTEFRVFETIRAGEPVSRRERHPFDRFYNFFNRSSWQVSDLARAVAILIVTRLALSDPLKLIIDDTLLHKWGDSVFGIGWFHDAVASTEKRSVTARGNNWVVVALAFRVPFADRVFCLPIHAMLRRAGDEHPGPADLALSMLQEIFAWFPDRLFKLIADGGYSSANLLKELPQAVTHVGLMRNDAALHDVTVPKRRKGQRGPTPRYGKRLPTPKQRSRLADRKSPSKENRWQSRVVKVYGEQRRFHALSFIALWPRVLGRRPIKVVISRPLDSRFKEVCLYTTDLKADPAEVIQDYAERVSIEACFKDSKQIMQIEKPQHWSRSSIEKLAPWVWLMQSLMTFWYLTAGRKTPEAQHSRKLMGDWDTEWSLRNMLRVLRRTVIVDRINSMSERKRDLRQLANELENYLFLAG